MGSPAHAPTSRVLCDVAGYRSQHRVRARTTHPARHRCAQNADHLANNSPFSAFFTEVVCTLGTALPLTATSPPPNEKNFATRGSDTSATRHQKASCRKPHQRQCGGCRRARLRCPWAAAGPGRASRRRAERSSRRRRLAGGPPPTGTPSSPAAIAAGCEAQPGAPQPHNPHTRPHTQPTHSAHTLARASHIDESAHPCRGGRF